MVTAYHFLDPSVDRPPSTGQVVHAFRTLQDLRHFVRLQGSGSWTFRYYEVTGILVKDHGTKDGLEIRVSSSKEIRL